MELIRYQASTGTCRLELEAKGKLHLPRRIGISCAHEVGRHLVRSMEVIDSNMLSAELELRCIGS
jgi:hypothetical protein